MTQFGLNPPLSPTLAPLVEYGGLSPREALKSIASAGVFRFVQLSAALPEMRPRDLDRSARRDLKARLQRLELISSGFDLWIPREHFSDPVHCERAVNALLGALELSAEIGGGPVSTEFPESVDPSLRQTINDRADACGVRIADFSGYQVGDESGGDGLIGCGIDPARELSADRNPAETVLQSKGIVSARFSDADRAGRVIPGMGRLDITEYQIALATVRYESVVVLDLRSLPAPETAMIQSTEKWGRSDS